jgi:hypothetical protein
MVRTDIIRRAPVAVPRHLTLRNGHTCANDASHVSSLAFTAKSGNNEPSKYILNCKLRWGDHGK